LVQLFVQQLKFSQFAKWSALIYSADNYKTLNIKRQAGIQHRCAETKIATCKKKRSKLALISLSPLLLIVFVVGWLISWIGQSGQ